MALVASMLAYLAAVSGISIGAVMLVCAFLAAPGQPTFPQHGGATATKSGKPISLKASRSTRRTAGKLRRQPSVRLSASYSRHGARKVTLRQNSRSAGALGRSSKWARQDEPTVFHRSMSYAQAPSVAFSRVW